MVAAKAGNGDALRYLYVRYADEVHRYVCTIVHEAHEAEDITRQVFSKLTGALCDYEQGEVPFAAWVLRFAHDVALYHLRSLRAVPTEGARG